MSLADELKTRVNAAVKGGDGLTRDALRAVLGEAQAEAVRRKGEVTDDVVLAVVRKTVDKSAPPATAFTSEPEYPEPARLGQRGEIAWVADQPHRYFERVEFDIEPYPRVWHGRR